MKAEVAAGWSRLCSKAIFGIPIALVAIVILAAAARLAVLAGLNTLPVSDAADFNLIARRLSAGLGYSTESGPTAYWPPGYPLLLGAVYRLFGTSLVVAKALNLVCGVATVIMTFLLAKTVGARDRVAWLSALLAGMFPSLVFYTNSVTSETLATFLVVATVALAWNMDRRTPLTSALLGLLLGLLLLTRPLLAVAPLAVMVGHMYWSKGRDLKPLRLGVTVVVAAVVVSGWGVRNYFQMNALVPISTNGGVDFWIGNSPGAAGGYYEPPSDDPVRSLGGEVERNSAGYLDGASWALHHPVSELKLVVLKELQFFARDHGTLGFPLAATALEGPSSGRLALYIIDDLYYLAMGCMAVGGFLLALRRRERSLTLLGLVIVAVAAMHVAFFAVPRFHLPILPFAAVLAAFFIEYVFSSPKIGLHQRSSPFSREQRVGPASRCLNRRSQQGNAACQPAWARQRQAVKQRVGDRQHPGGSGTAR
jgi:4-amino-4-deoxy-L-arabinose transferase-like glycosyltransferase